MDFWLFASAILLVAGPDSTVIVPLAVKAAIAICGLPGGGKHRECFLWPLIELGQRRAVLSESLKDQLNRSLQLRVSASDIILRVEQDFFVGVAAADFLPPSRRLRTRRHTQAES